MHHLFSAIAIWTSKECGRSHTFVLACLVVLIWAASGPYFHYSDTWQLVINTGTTVITFLMVFLLQNTQARDNLAMQLKLDELIRVNVEAHNTLIDIEEKSDEELVAIRQTLNQDLKTDALSHHRD